MMIDWRVIEGLRNEFGTDWCVEMVDLFLEETSGVIDALKPDNRESFGQQVHFIKGSAESLGLVRLAHLCRETESGGGLDVRAREIATAFHETCTQLTDWVVVLRSGIQTGSGPR